MWIYSPPGRDQKHASHTYYGSWGHCNSPKGLGKLKKK